MADEPSTPKSELEVEQQWIDRRGGGTWIDTYVKPFRTWGGYGPQARAAASASIPALRARANELSLDEISTMIAMMQWRFQKVGTWFAIARAEPALSMAVNRGLTRCFGRFTAPSLIAAALTYPNAETVEAITEYRDRDLAHQYGAAGIADAALHRLQTHRPPAAQVDAELLDHLLAIAGELQQTV